MNYFFIKKTMKLVKYTTIILFSVFFILGCSSIKETVTGSKKQNTNEFFVKTKNPLVLPPDYDELPKPQKEKIEKSIEDKSIDFSSVLNKSNNKKKIITKKNNSLERSISDILSGK